MSQIKRKVAFYTLGCKLNFAETSYISTLFPEDRYTKVSPDQQADIYVINTCTVTSEADRKCRQAIRKFINRSPSSIIAVIGCYSQLRAKEIANIPGVDIVLGTKDKFNLVSLLDRTNSKAQTAITEAGNIEEEKEFIHSWSSGDRTRKFIKVQDGCDYRCAYCTVPLARGRSRNAPISSIIEEIKNISSGGVPEIVITGVNIGDFGKSTGESFTELLRQIENLEEIKRIRLSSIEPDLLKDEIIEMVAKSSKIMPHFHIPLQSGSDKILRLMRRRYTATLFISLVEKIRRAIPLAGIGADIITGFPGETEKDFNETFSLIDSLSVSYLHVFPYSERPGTPAREFKDKVKPEVRNERRKKLTELSKKKNMEFKLMNINSIHEVLFENRIKNIMISGFTGNYLRVEHPFEKGLQGTIRKVLITGINPSGNMSVKLID
ncbi:MAG: tRNA (N(6)-L-threonylcarbamoyladenosine(37)-C(2))-methylthiotransferase MtaB [Bacteroidales bacterium]